MPNKQEIKFCKRRIKILRKEYGKPCKEFDMSCADCQAHMVITWIENYTNKVVKLREWKVVWRASDTRANGLFEAICPHGTGHHRGVHGCDLVNGKPCCDSCPAEMWKLTTKE